MKKKPCPVDRGKLLIGLEHCPNDKVGCCYSCPYKYDIARTCVNNVMKDALAYIYYLEELLNAKADNPN